MHFAGVRRAIELIDQDDDGTIDLAEWRAALQPRRHVRVDAAPYLTVEQKNLFQRAWMESLAHLLDVMISADAEIHEKRSTLKLDGARIFTDMDRHNLGYVSVNAFSHWVSENCGYTLADEDLPGLADALDGGNEYRISREAFIEAVSAAEPEEEEPKPAGSKLQAPTAMAASAQKQQKQTKK